MKSIFAALVLLILFHTSVSFAEEAPGSINDVRKEIIKLYDNYVSLIKELKGIGNNIKSFTNTTLNISLLKHDTGIRLISVEIHDNEQLIESHTYLPIENEALNAGGRHLLHKAEAKQGKHDLNVSYIWTEGNNAPQKGTANIPLSVSTGYNYFIELSLDKKGSKVNLNFSQLFFENQ